ncbi:NAD(P)H dehydrogenase (quinone) [Lactiplantibacillus plantarum subsp. plantarum]|uniref:NAD(P)H dehydrogenase (Quinone) n=1 Tax=Lactiplantibacillus plantarum subsp. plantarum TaxID=337330 RepID=A0A2S3U8Y7_LACPN|nr:NAD(P)H dehydrogenase (quinone) [Lactiplantibacillus plantarum subsp. plantarum]
MATSDVNQLKSLQLLDKAQLVFTAPTEKGLVEYQQQGITTKVTDFNNPDSLVKAFSGAKKVLLIFNAIRRRKASSGS